MPELPTLFDIFPQIDKKNKKKNISKIRTFAKFEIFINKENLKIIIKKSNKIMKQLDFKNENVKNAVIEITNDILNENVENSKTYIPILDDELVLDEAISYHACYPIKLDDDKEYLRVSLGDIRIGSGDVENEMDMDYYFNLTDEDGEPLGDDFVETEEYQEEYKSIEEDLIEEYTIPYVFDEINKAIEDYNYNKKFEVS